MKNKLLLIGIILVFILNMVACDSISTDAFTGKRLQAVEDTWATVKGKLVIDRQTGVEYWYIEPKAGEGGSYCLTLLVDQDGKPLIWKGE